MLLSFIVCFALSVAQRQAIADNSIVSAPVVFTGGHETDPRDHGRPVNLIAFALGVDPGVFREAFSHVHPAPPGTEPDQEQVRQNKEALMNALSQFKVTNERLDTVSNYYRYNRSRGELWKTRPAVAHALVKNGVITRYVVTDGGAGYSSPPTVSVPSVPGAVGRAQISFSVELEQNGYVSDITVAHNL